MANNMHQAVWDWLQGCPHIADLFFNLSQTENGDTQMIPSETIKTQYIDGSSERYYHVALNRFMMMSEDPNDIANITMTVDFDAISEWIDEQFESGNLPELTDGMSINNIEVMPNESGFMVAQDANIGKYMLQFRIEYFKP